MYFLEVHWTNSKLCIYWSMYNSVTCLQIFIKGTEHSQRPSFAFKNDELKQPIIKSQENRLSRSGEILAYLPQKIVLHYIDHSSNSNFQYTSRVFLKILNIFCINVWYSNTFSPDSFYTIFYLITTWTDLSTLTTSPCPTRFPCLSHGLTVECSFRMVLKVLSGFSLKLTIS